MYLLNHLPSDALQCGQEQKQLPKPALRVVLPVVDVVLQTQLHLEPHVLNLYDHLALLHLDQKIQLPSNKHIHCHQSEFLEVVGPARLEPGRPHG